jgi:hypothetical protein
MLPTKNSPSEGIKYLTIEQILAIHETLINRYGGSHGIRDKGLLESAVFRPQTVIFGKEAYPALFEKCAVLGYSIIQNHPFLDGNKRAGFAARLGPFGTETILPSAAVYSSQICRNSLVTRKN